MIFEKFGRALFFNGFSDFSVKMVSLRLLKNEKSLIFQCITETRVEHFSAIFDYISDFWHGVDVHQICPFRLPAA